MTRSEFFDLPLLSSLFPLVFKNGVRWTRFSGLCGHCDRKLQQGEIRGSVTRPFDSVFVVDAVGLCGACGMITPFKYRLHRDLGITGVSPQTGEWARWQAHRPSLWKRFLAWWSS